MEQLQIKSAMSQTTSEHLLSENAKLQVHITTLQSQTNSLNAQHTALQLANSQLVAEKEEVFSSRSLIAPPSLLHALFIMFRRIFVIHNHVLLVFSC